MNFKAIVILCLLAFCFFSCKKEVEDERPEFIGEWRYDEGSNFIFYISIDENSNGTYRSLSWYGGEQSKYCGIARATDTKLKIGRTHTFTILEYPHITDTAYCEALWNTNEGGLYEIWKMKLDAPPLYAGSGIYTKYVLLD